MAAPQKRELPHLVTLKVMRLGKPSFVVGVPLGTGEDEGVDVDVHDVDEEGISGKGTTKMIRGYRGEHDDGIGLCPSMRLAASFGEIYLGETFACYLTVQNVSTEVVSNMILKVICDGEEEEAWFVLEFKSVSIIFFLLSLFCFVSVHRRNFRQVASDIQCTIQRRRRHQVLVQEHLKIVFSSG